MPRPVVYGELAVHGETLPDTSTKPPTNTSPASAAGLAFPVVGVVLPVPPPSVAMLARLAMLPDGGPSTLTPAWTRDAPTFPRTVTTMPLGALDGAIIHAMYRRPLDAPPIPETTSSQFLPVTPSLGQVPNTLS